MMENWFIYAMDRKCSDTVVFLGVPKYFTLHYNAAAVTDSSKSAFIVFYS